MYCNLQYKLYVRFKNCLKTIGFLRFLVIVSCHLVILSSCHLVTLSSYVTLSSCHLVIMSSCHLVILSSCHHAHSPSFSQALTTALHVMVVFCVLLTLTTFRPSNDISIACDCIYLVCSVPRRSKHQAHAA